MEEKTVRMAMKNIQYNFMPSIDGGVEYVTFLSMLGYIHIDDPRTFTGRLIDDKILQEIIKKCR